MANLLNKQALVLGGSRGIGAAVVTRLQQDGPMKDVMHSFMAIKRHVMSGQKKLPAWSLISQALRRALLPAPNILSMVDFRPNASHLLIKRL